MIQFTKKKNFQNDPFKLKFFIDSSFFSQKNYNNFFFYQVPIYILTF